jgi:uncharacterized protein YkwD
MRSPRATDARKVPRHRSLLGAFALAVCFAVPAGTTTAFAVAFGSSRGPVARAVSAHQKAGRPHRRHAHHVVRCAKRSSFHSHGGHVHHKHRPTNCSKRESGKHGTSKRGSGKRGGTGEQRGGSHHAKSGQPTRHNAKRPAPGGIRRAAAGGSCPGADLRPGQGNIEAVRTATLCLIDRERSTDGEQPLQPNAHLQQAAQAHTESMAFGNYFEHDGPAGDTPLSRMVAAGYIYSSRIGYEIGENIGWGTIRLATPRAIVAAWMASPGHRANILDAHFRDTAVGVSPHPPSSLAQGQAGAIYTQDFGVITTG